MPSVKAKQFQVTFERTLAKGARISVKDVEKLEESASAIRDAKEKRAANEVLALVKHDRILDENEVGPARRALCRLLGVSSERLPQTLERALERAVPVPNVRVAEYDLRFDFTKAADGDSEFPAQARITLEAAAAKRVILEIDPDRLEIDEVRAAGKRVAFSVKDGRLVVDDTAGAKTLDVRYRVRATDDVKGYGLIRDKYAGRMWTLTWPYNTGALFPSSSNPSDGATAKVTVRVGRGEQVVGAGKKQSDGAFHLKDPVPAYAVAFTTGRFADNGVTKRGPYEARTVGLGSAMSTSLRREVREAVADSMKFLSEWLGPYPFGDRVNVVEIKSDYGGMEHAGAVAVGVGQTKPDTIEAAVHETVHHWFGDGVHIAHWGELWMSEGFTNYATFKFFQKRDGDKRFHELLDAAKGSLREQLSEGRSQPLQQRSDVDPQEGLSWVPYMHGVWMLRMLETTHGSAKVDGLLRDWYQAKRGTAVTTDDFIQFAKSEAGLDLRAFFDTWGKLESVPTVEDKSKVDGKTVTLSLKAKRGTGNDIAGQLEVPVVVEGGRGKRAELRVKVGEPVTVDVGFAIKRLHWDPKRTLLVDVE